MRFAMCEISGKKSPLQLKSPETSKESRKKFKSGETALVMGSVLIFGPKVSAGTGCARGFPRDGGGDNVAGSRSAVDMWGAAVT